VIAAGCLAFERRIEMAERHHLVRPAGAAALGALNCLELISGTQWLCLAPAGGVGGAVYCRTQGGDCLEVWKGCGCWCPDGGILLAQLDGRRRHLEEPTGP